jgi:hypothetical protein
VVGTTILITITTTKESGSKKIKSRTSNRAIYCGYLQVARVLNNFDATEDQLFETKLLVNCGNSIQKKKKLYSSKDSALNKGIGMLT